MFFQTKCIECGVRGKVEVKFWACVQCTYHNKIEIINCEMCSFSKTQFTNSSSLIKLSFRGTGSKTFYEKLSSNMQAKEWEVPEII